MKILNDNIIRDCRSAYLIGIGGAGMSGLIAATTSSFVAPLARLVRGRVLEVRQEEFVQAAVAAGLRDARILARHVLPHATTTLVIETSLLAGQAVLIGTTVTQRT